MSIILIFDSIYKTDDTMTQKCAITGKMPLAGNSVSHAHNKNRKKFNPNLHKHRLWHPGLKQYIRLRLSAKGIRIIDKYGIEAVLDAIKNNRKIRKPEAMKQEKA